VAILAGMLATALLLGPGPSAGEPPAPKIEGPLEAPIEGPARPPAKEEEAQAPTSEPEIELPTEPPEPEPELEEEPTWPTPGNAPSDGWGLIVAGAILMPTAALASWGLITDAKGKTNRTGILVAGAGFEAIGVGLLAAGLYRQAKLKRWAVGYRVVARPQGSGLLAAGGLAASLGMSILGIGISGIVRGRKEKNSGLVAEGAIFTAVGATGVAVIATPTIYFGRLRRLDYHATGGWYRPALPTVQIVPQLLVSRTTLGLGVAGRF
jgi:hypothetical protein